MSMSMVYFSVPYCLLHLTHDDVLCINAYVITLTVMLHVTRVSCKCRIASKLFYTKEEKLFVLIPIVQALPARDFYVEIEYRCEAFNLCLTDTKADQRKKKHIFALL